MSLASKLSLKSDSEFERKFARAEERVNCLKDVALFADIGKMQGALEDLARMMELKRFMPGECIIKEGESGSEMFLLIQGEASVHKSTSEGDLYKVAILHGEKHAFFGEGGLLDSDARSATIQADSECHCLVLSRKSFEIFGAAHPQWALPISLRIARAVMARLRKTNNDLMLLYNALVAEIRGS
jgi:CRP/FNR family cyclic AMP-dependent transcriptional regulator